MASNDVVLELEMFVLIDDPMVCYTYSTVLYAMYTERGTGATEVCHTVSISVIVMCNVMNPSLQQYSRSAEKTFSGGQFMFSKVLLTTILSLARFHVPVNHGDCAPAFLKH